MILLAVLHAGSSNYGCHGFLHSRNGLSVESHLVNKKIMKQYGKGPVSKTSSFGRSVGCFDVTTVTKMSSISGDSDFGINPKATEARWLDSVSTTKREVFKLTTLGLDMLKELELDEAAEAFDRVFELNPSAYVWQAGIVKYYRDELQEAAGILARSVIQSESRYGLPASEERIWRDACEIKYLGTLSENERKALSKQIEDVFPKPRENNRLDTVPTKESRKVFRIAKDLFSSSTTQDQMGVALGRAKLRALSGPSDIKPKPDKKMWKLNSWYYLGLHYDALGDEKESKECMQMALRFCPTSTTVDDIMYSLPKLHLKARNWIDDSVTLSYEEAVATLDIVKVSENKESNPLVFATVQKSILKMDLKQLQDALQTKNMDTTGSEETLRCRLFDSLVDDMNLEA